MKEMAFMSVPEPVKLKTKSFLEVKRRAVSVSNAGPVTAGRLSADQTLPLVIEPAVERVELGGWAAQHHDFIDDRLREHGAMLFRGFQVEGLEGLEQFITSVSGSLLEYNDGSSPRTKVSGNIYTSTDHPPEHRIFLHNENSYSYSWPLKIFFSCVLPPLQGGETPIADVRRVLKSIDPRIRERFERKQVMYVRNFGDGLGLSWPAVFQTTSKAAVSEFCRLSNISVEWRDDNHLRTRQVRPAIVKHPLTGELIWFNHAAFFHVSTLEPAIRDALLSEFREEDLPFNTYYGDGSPIEPAVLDEVREAYRQHTVTFPWQKDDVLMLDNMLTAHGRASFTGERKIVVGMSELFDRLSHALES